MSRLIDADYVLKALGVFNDRQNGNVHYLNGIETAREIVQDAPTIEADIQRGHWIDRDALIDALMMYTWRDEDGFLIDDSNEKRKFIENWLPDLPTIDALVTMNAEDG